MIFYCKFILASGRFDPSGQFDPFWKTTIYAHSDHEVKWEPVHFIHGDKNLPSHIKNMLLLAHKHLDKVLIDIVTKNGGNYIYEALTLV